MFYSLSKKILAFSLVAVLLLFPFGENKTQATISTTLNKTMEFFIGQDGIVRSSGEQASFYFNNVIIPETPSVKSAFIEINGVAYNNSGNQTINADLKQAHGAAGAGIDYTLGGSTSPHPFTLRYDAWQGGAGPMSNITAAGVYDYTLYIKGTSSGGTGSYSISSAKLILTYNHSSGGNDFLKTTKFFVGQETGSTADGVAVSKNFTISISELSPVIRSVFVEATGIAKGSGVGTIGVSVVNQGFAANYTNYSLDLSGSTSVTPFTARYDASGTILSSSFPGGANYTLYLKGTGFSTNIWSAKVIVTYKYSEGTGGLPVSGYVISSTVDTGITKGAAYNSLMWKGSLNSGSVGQVGLQIAASASIAGPWLFEGPDCTSGTSYIPNANTPIPIETDCVSGHNNMRYFRYKVIICSSVDCATSGSTNPQVDEVVVNWSP